MAKFKLGQRVKVQSAFRGQDCDFLVRKIGVVADTSSYPDGSHIGVRFARWEDGHDMNGEGNNQGITSGWYIAREFLKLIDVVHKGKTYRVVRKGKKIKK